jgi:hypothetical protein
MRFIYFILFLLLISPQSYTQLNCKKTKTSDSNVETCLHKNGKISTIQTWDLTRRNGSIEGFNNQGQSIFKFYLRTYAGHASAQWEYYPNGQVKKVNYSSAPDGGIQHYSGSRTYDENGNQTSSYDDEYPPRLITRIDLEQIKKNEKIESESSKNYYTTLFQVSNQTRKKQIILYKLKNQSQIHRKIIKPNHFIFLDSIKSSSPKSFENIEIMQLQNNNSRFQILKPQEMDKSLNQTTWIWFIVSKKK